MKDKKNENLKDWMKNRRYVLFITIGCVFGFLISLLPYSGTHTTQSLLVPIVYIMKILGVYSTGGDTNLAYAIVFLPIFYVIVGGLIGFIIAKLWKK